MTDGDDYGRYFDDLINAGLCDRLKTTGLRWAHAFGVNGSRLNNLLAAVVKGGFFSLIFRSKPLLFAATERSIRTKLVYTAITKSTKTSKNRSRRNNV